MKKKTGKKKRFPLKTERILLRVSKEDKERYEEEASIAGYTLNVYLREKLKRG